MILAEVVRSGVVESVHRGSVVVLGSDGSVELAAGDVTSPMFPRSASKPLQATGMLRSGLPATTVEGELLALVTASHSGEAFHVEGVRRILSSAGLDETALRCPSAWPIDQDARTQATEKTRPQMNCSGKHAGMLATCVVNRWPTATYTDPSHPLQVRLREAIEDLAGEKVALTGVDGCGAALFGFGLTGLARAFREMVLAPDGSAERRVVDAVRAYPEWTSGTTRDEAALIREVPGLFGKSGAEGCYAVALPDGRAVALKIEDGSDRARPVVMASVLARLGYEVEQGAPVHGGDDRVGEIRAAPLS